MLPVYFASVLFVSARTTLSAPVTYDQQQTGDINLQIHLKDIQIIALLDSGLGDYGDYDYAYDYSDFTIKPIGGSTTSSSTSVSTTTVKPWNTWPTVAPSSSTEESYTSEVSTSISNNSLDKNSTVENSLVDKDSSEDTSSTSAVSVEDSSTVKTRINNKTGNLFGDEDILKETKETLPAAVSSSSSNSTTNRSVKRCNRGYAVDKNGRCRRHTRRRISLLPFGIKLAPKLMQQLRHSQETTHNSKQ